MPFNLKYLNELFPDNPETILNLLRMFTQHSAQDYLLFQRAIEDKDTTTITLLSHKLKSNVSIFGLTAVKDLFARIEELSRRQSESMFDEIAELYVELDARMTEALKAAHQIVGK